MNKSIYNKLTKFWIPLAIILNALFLVLQIVLLFLDVSSLIGTIFVCIIQLIADGILYIYSYRLMTNQVNMKYGLRAYKEYRKAKREILEGKLDKASDRAIAVMSETSKIRNTVKKVNRKFRLVIILATVLSMIVSTMLSYYTFIVEDSSLGAIIENIISKKKEDEKKDDYEWDFGEATPKTFKKEIDNKTYEYSYEGDLVVQIALEVAQKYRDEGLIGGDLIWQWAGRNGWPFSKATAMIPYNGVNWSTSRGYAVWEWCSTFAVYCANMSGLTEPGCTLEGIDNRKYCNFFSSTDTYNFCVKKGWEVYDEFSSYVPQPGDFVFFKEASGFKHTGLFYKVDGDIYRTIEGNVNGSSRPGLHTCETSIVTDTREYRLDKNNRLMNSSGSRRLIIVHPPYKTIKKVSGGLDILKILEYYEREDDGYIKDTQQVIYDVMVSYLGYSTEAACAMIVNNYCESAYYDQFEGHLTGGHFGNGNWKYITEYKVNTKEEADKYLRGMTSYNKGGYGIVQWTGGRIQGYLDTCDKINMCACGPQTFPAQIMWLTEELKSGTRGPRTTTALNDCAGKGIDGVKYTARVLRHDYETPGVCCIYNASHTKIIGRKDFNTCDGCSGQIAQNWGGVPLYQFVWNKWGNTKPLVDFSSGTGNTTAQNASFSDVVMIGDSNTVRMKSSGTSITNAKKIIAEVGEGLSSTTILNQIKALKTDDLSNVCIMLGTNNFSSQKVQFVSAYENLINEIYQINPNANITLCTIPRVNDSYSPSIKDATTVTISDWIKEIANKGNLNLIDVNSHLTPNDMSTTSGDGYHLNISNGGVQKCADFITSSYTGSSGTTNTGGITPVVSR